jgi:Transposase IS200 like
VFIPKCRRKTPYQELRRHLDEVFHQLAVQKESKVEEGHLMPDHVHMLLSIPPKYAVSQMAGFAGDTYPKSGDSPWICNRRVRVPRGWDECGFSFLRRLGPISRFSQQIGSKKQDVQRSVRDRVLEGSDALRGDALWVLCSS